MKLQRVFRIFCWILGSAAFAAVFKSTGAEPLHAVQSALSGWGAGVLAVYAAVCVWDVWGWQVVVLGTQGSRVRFADLYLIRLAGEAVNSVTPFVDVGGEFLKVTLAAKRFKMEKRAVLASVVIERTALLASEVVFWFMGLAAALVWVPQLRESQAAWWIGALIFIPILAGLYWVSHKGFFASFYGLIRRWIKTKDKAATDFEEKIQDVDARITQFYARETFRNAATLVLHLAGWVFGGLETWLMFRAVGVPVTLAEGIILEALLQMIRTVSFFIPGNLGAQEAGLAFFGGWFGYAGPAGVAVSLLKRLRQLVWTAIGFGVWRWYDDGSSTGKGSHEVQDSQRIA